MKVFKVFYLIVKCYEFYAKMILGYHLEGDSKTTCGFHNDAENIDFNNPVPICLRM